MELTETLLIVDDEETVCRTFRDWIAEARLGVDVRTAADAEAALRLANERTIDLAILDWNLGAGDDGLQLLQDLAAFHPEVVAIMVTGFANQATPLDAMRMGVRDYLDKNHDLNRATFLAAVKRQLDAIRPTKRARHMQRGLLAFRTAVEKVLPLVESAAALTDPVPLPDAIRALVRFLVKVTQARDGLLIVRHFDADQQAETLRVYDADGTPVEGAWLPFARSAAGAAVGMGRPSAMNDLDQPGFELQPFERGRRSLLAVPLPVAAGTQVVIELFDREGGFASADVQLVGSAADLGTELLRHALGQRQTQRLLHDAVAAALKASDAMARSFDADTPEPPAAALQALRDNLDDATAARSLALAEAIRALSARHGDAALDHCLQSVRQVQRLLDAVTGGERTDV